MNNLETKIIEAFEGKVVRKDLAFEVKGGLPLLSGNGVWSIITIGYISGDDVPTGGRR